MVTSRLIDDEELQANNEITELINDITVLKDRNDPLLGVMKSPILLIRGLTELRSLIEMVEIKKSIVDQVKFLLTNYIRKKDNSVNNTKFQFEGHMLHSVISGNPGTGKTTVGIILAKIWMALGFIREENNQTPKSQQNQESSKKQIKASSSGDIVNNSYRLKIYDLQEREQMLQQRINYLQETLVQTQTAATEIRKLVIKLKPGPSKFKYNIIDQDPEWDKLINETKSLRICVDKAIKNTQNKQISSVKKSKTPEVPRIQRISENYSKPKLDYINLSRSETSTEKEISATPKDPYLDMDPKFIIATREDFVAEYLGQTAPKTRRVLDSARGGVLFIDEAYSLCNMDGGSKDKFGEECLTTINEYMSLHADEIIIIFAGYKDKLLNTIFKAQAGLFRRCAWFFEIKDYTPKGLSRIFLKQLEKNSWKLSSDIDLESLLFNNKNIILDGGGGTGKLAFFVKIEYGRQKFKEALLSNNTSNIHDSVITSEMICNAIARYQKHLADRFESQNIYYNMYI